MSGPSHDSDSPTTRGRQDAAEPATAEHAAVAEDAAVADAARRIEAAQRWLVSELRDECSDIGVSARGLDLEAFAAGVAVFAREAHRLGALPERMLVLLKQCLSDDAIPWSDRELYRLYVDVAVGAAVRAYFGRGADAATGGAFGAERPAG